MISQWPELAALALLGLVLATAGCLEGEDGEIDPEDPVPTAMSIVPGPATLAYFGEAKEFTVVIHDQYGEDIEAAVSWSGTDASVFTVAADSAGAKVTAVANGTATLVALAADLIATATVTVEQRPARMEVVSGDNQGGLRGETLSVPLVVRMVDHGGTGTAGVAVTFAANDEDGEVSESEVESDSTGRAATLWTLGMQRMQSAAASAGSANHRFTATAFSDPPIPDYAFLGRLAVTRRDPLDTDTIEISVAISNLGDGAGPGRFPVRLTLDEEPLRTLNVDQVAPGATTAVTFTVGPLEVGRRQVGLEIDPGDGIVVCGLRGRWPRW